MSVIKPFLGFIVAAVLVLGGCVTKGEYEKLEADKNQEIAQLRKEREALQKQRAELQEQRAELQEQIQNLESQRGKVEIQKRMLEREQVALQTRVGLLGDQTASLEQQKKSLEEQKASLEEQQVELRKQVEALEQQKTELLKSSKESQSQYDALVKNLTEEVQKGQLQVRQYKNMLTVDLAEQLFFDSGQANLKTSGKQVLKKVGESLKAYDDKIIRVIGHTDNVPIAKSRQKNFPSNWELSVARATTVVRYLQEIGIPPERMVASGRGEYAPIAPNNTADGRKKNRRIEITLIDKSLEQETNRAAK